MPGASARWRPGWWREASRSAAARSIEEIGKPSSAERSLAGRVGAYIVHSRYDLLEITAAARAAFRSKFVREVDPDGLIPEPERLRRAEIAREAHFAKLALKSAQARRKKRERREAAIARHFGER